MTINKQTKTLIKMDKNPKKTFTKTMPSLLLLTLLFLYIPIISNGLETCAPSNCPNSVTKSDFSIDVSVHYPFYLRNLQADNCGLPGFDLQCNPTLGTILKFPNKIVLRVEGIYYNSNQIILSDPYDHCIPDKLMSLDLTKSQFSPFDITSDFWLYNCSSDRNYEEHDQIECLSGSSYTILSFGSDDSKDVIDGFNCKLLKVLTDVPVPYISSRLSYVSTLSLTWNGATIPPPPPPPPPPAPEITLNSKFNSVITKISLILVIIIVLMGLITGCRYLSLIRVQPTSTINPHTTTVIDSTNVIIPGLNQVTIDSYPQLVVGESGRLTKPDDNICAICLSNYRPRDKLKVLPECLHRFHVDCIDEWLRAKGICPICRTLPPHIIS